MNTSVEFQSLLEAARIRGDAAYHGEIIPPGFSALTGQLSIYTGLMSLASKSMDLATLIATEQRDRAVIEAHYGIHKLSIEASMEAARQDLIVMFQENQANREIARSLIERLADKGYLELAAQLLIKLFDTLNKVDVRARVDMRNEAALASRSRITVV